MNQQMMNEIRKLSQTEKLNLAKNMLTDLGFFTGNLWHVEDVQTLFNCDKEKAINILNDALESNMDYIWDAIKIVGEDKYQLKLKY